MGTNTKVGPNQEPAKRFDWVALVDPETGEAAAGTGGGGSISAEATAAPPSYEEGASAPLSMDLDGNLRVVGAFEAPVGGSLEDTQLMVLGAVQAVQAAIEAPVDELPPEPLQATTGLVVATIAKTSTGDTAIVAAVSGQTTRVHRMKFTCDAANLILVKRGSTVIDRFRFPASGGAAVLEFSSFPWYVTGDNEAFQINCSTTANVDGSVETVTSA